MFSTIKTFGVFMIAVLMATPLTFGQTPQQQGIVKIEPPKPDSGAEIVEKASHLIGYKSTEDLLQQGYQFDKKAFLEGVKQAFEKVELTITDEEARSCLMAYQQYCEVEKNKRKSQIGEDNKKEGEAFLAKNAEKEGVKKLPSGVQYEVLKSGDGGESPKESDQVTIHYHGTHIDGTVFDSSVKKGKPITFAANGFVPGFSQALQAMKVGDKWRVVIPGDLAYGANGKGDIGPNCTLIFELELLSISGK